MTKGLLITVFAVFLFSSAKHEAFAVPRDLSDGLKNNFEISIAGSVQRQGFTHYFTTYNLNDGVVEETYWHLYLPVRLGYFPIRCFEIEAEFILSFEYSDDPSYYISGLISYNFPFSNSPVMPFILAGYGYTNAPPLSSLALDDYLFDAKPVINLGIGAKNFLGRSVALRTEIRYQLVEFERVLVVYTTRYKYENLMLSIGLSFIP